MVESSSSPQLILPTTLNEVDLEAWSDVDSMQNISLSSMDLNNRYYI